MRAARWQGGRENLSSTNFKMLKPRELYKAQAKQYFQAFELQDVVLIWHLFGNIHES